MNKRTFIYSFHFLLLPIFFVWHVYNGYFGLIPFHYAGLFMIYYLMLALLIFFTGKFILRNNTKSACWTTALLIIFFFWGASYEFVKGLGLPALFISFKLWLIIAALLIVILLLLLKKQAPPVKASRFFLLLFTVFLLFEAGNSVYKLLRKEDRKNDLAFHNKPLSIIATGSNEKRPDIFFIVFDEYASTRSLKEYFNLDNSGLDSLLIKNKFYLAANSKSNYNSTGYSLASSLGLQYFETALEMMPTDSRMMLKSQYSYKKSFLPRFLAQQGYAVKNYGLMSLEDYPIDFEPHFTPDIKMALYKETLWGQVETMLQIKNISLYSQKRKYRDEVIDQQKTINRNRVNFHHVLDELKKQDLQPKFVVCHIMMPHSPYYFNRNGGTRLPGPDEYTLHRDSLYFDQLLYTNTWIDSLAKASTENFDRPRVVIMEGDHGKRDRQPGKGDFSREMSFMNLNSFYFSDHDYQLLYDSISPVNSFRVVLNKYFDARLPLLKDSTVFLY